MLKIEPGREASTPRHAATVVLLRDVADGFEVFMVRRHVASGFMGGAYVFPGGKLDDADQDPALLARTTGRSVDEAAAALGEPEEPARAAGLFVAAIRETFEEAGVLLADHGADADLRAAREALRAGTSLGEVVRRLDATLRLDRIVPWTRWVTPAVEPRRYDTRFFLAVSPPQVRPEHDRHETTEAAWMTPAGALARGRAAEIQLPPPTMRSLEMLCAFATTADAIRDARSRIPPLVEPVFQDRDGVWALLLPGDADHPIDEVRIPGPTRFVLIDGTWRSGDG